jgi:putative ABC transport system permease protein
MFQVLLRTSDPDRVIPELRRRLQAFDAEMPVFDVRSLDDVVSDATATIRYSSRLLVLSALLAAILCRTGVYSAFAFLVAARRRELGIRIALGARPRTLASDVLRRAASVAVLGLAAGVPLALASSTALGGLLFEVSPRDPVVATVAADV